jgi:hypothetical protein
MSELKPKIMASSLEEFKEISDKLATLPECVVQQIETAGKTLVGIECKIRYRFRTDCQTIYLPKTTHIKDFGDCIGCYCDNFFFRIGEEVKKYPIEYVFVDNLKQQ